MKRSVVAAVVIVGVALVLVALFRPSAQVEQESDEQGAPVIGHTAGSAPETAPLPRDQAEREDWFPDLRDGSGIPGLGGGVTEGRTTFGCDIEDLLEDAAPILAGADRGTRDPRLNTLMETLSASADAELLLANVAVRAFQANVGSEENFEAVEAAAFADLARALRTDPTNPVVLWYASWYCAGTTVSCDDPLLQRNSEVILGANGVYWVREAGSLYLDGERDAALEALRRSVAAPTFDNYFIDHIRLMQRALTLAPDIGYLERAVLAYAVTEDMHPNFRKHHMCESEAESDAEWYEVCLSLAQRAATEGQSIRDRIIAADLMESLHTMRGETAQADEAAALVERLDRVRDGDADFAALVLTDERVMSQFFDEFDAGDELSAMEYVQSEVERLLRDPDFDPCPAEDASEATE